MGMGMLFAGALTGGARAVGEMADQAIKREDDAQVRQQSIMDRRNELLFEMKAKADMAQEQERADAEGYVKATERGRAMGDDRRFAKFREDIKTSGYGEGMGEDELRKVFSDNYNDKVVAGSDRYYEPESADRRDALQAARSSGASGAVLKALDAEHKGMLSAERQAKVDADREAREELRYKRQLERDEMIFGQRKELQGDRIAAQATRTEDKPFKFDDIQRAELKKAESAVDDAKDALKDARPKERAARQQALDEAKKAYNETFDRLTQGVRGVKATSSAAAPGAQAPNEDRGPGDIAALEREIALVERGNDAPGVKQERLLALNSELKKERDKLAQKSAVKDNPTTKPSISSIAGAPSGSSIGAFVSGKGWEVRSGGKLIGYAKE